MINQLPIERNESAVDFIFNSPSTSQAEEQVDVDLDDISIIDNGNSDDEEEIILVECRNQEKKFAWVYKWITEEGTTKVVCDGVSTLSCYLSLGIIAWVHLTFG